MSNESQNEHWNPREDTSAHIKKFMDIGCNYHLSGCETTKKCRQDHMILLLHCQYNIMSCKLCNLVFIKKGTLELHNLELKQPCDTFFWLVGHLVILPSKTNLSAVLLRTAHTITMGQFLSSHFTLYPLNWWYITKRSIPWCENIQFLRIILCLEEGKLCQSRVKMFCVLCGMGLPTLLAVFVLCMVLLKPASAALGHNRGYLSIVCWSFKLLVAWCPGLSVVLWLDRCFSGCMP